MDAADFSFTTTAKQSPFVSSTILGVQTLSTLKSSRTDIGVHTLCLLDIKVKEQSLENMARGRLIYEPPRYMTVNQCVEQLLEIEENREEGGIIYLIVAYSKNSIGVGMSRVGADHQQIICGTLTELPDADFGAPLHSFVLAGTMRFLEADTLRQYAINKETFDKYAKISQH